MPGSSLWLVPPPDHPLHGILTTLITKSLPEAFPDLAGPSFSPHMTLTSEIDPALYRDDPQAWLDSIPWPASPDVKVRFDPGFGSVATQDFFFRRCYAKVAFDGVRQIAGLARARGVNAETDIAAKTEEWFQHWIKAFGPHVSLIYSATPIDEQTQERISAVVEDASIYIGGKEGVPDGLYGGWDGGVVWLVPTDRPVSEWKPIATKTLT